MLRDCSYSLKVIGPVKPLFIARLVQDSSHNLLKNQKKNAFTIKNKYTYSEKKFRYNFSEAPRGTSN